MTPEEELEQLQRRLQELESTSAFQERTLDQLDEVLREFTTRVQRIESVVRRLEEELEKEKDDSEEQP